jgi:hypothetical protein
LEEIKRMLSHIVSSRTLQEAAKVGALSNKCKNILTGLFCLVPSYFVPLFGVFLQSGAS